jgi:TRAP-type transport system small permease protein
MANINSRSEQIANAEQIIHTLNRIASWVAYFVIAVMMTFVFYDVIARALGHPTPGSNDVVQLLTIVAVAFAMGYTQILKRHPSISFIAEKLSSRPRAILSAVISLLGLIPFILLAWNSLVFARRMWTTNEGTMTLAIPIYPFIYCIAFGSILLCLVLIMNFVTDLRKAVL